MLEKDWVDYRLEELELMYGVDHTDVEYPEFDMDGSRFMPELSHEEYEKEIAVMLSTSVRLQFF